jgi:hypothetical protein
MTEKMLDPKLLMMLAVGTLLLLNGLSGGSFFSFRWPGQK